MAVAPQAIPAVDLAHLAFGGWSGEGWGGEGWIVVAALLPALLLGILLARPVKARISEAALRQVFSFLVLAMGAAMLGQTLYKVLIT